MPDPSRDVDAGPVPHHHWRSREPSAVLGQLLGTRRGTAHLVDGAQPSATTRHPRETRTGTLIGGQDRTHHREGVAVGGRGAGVLEGPGAL